MWTKNDIEFKTRMNQLCYKEMKEKVVDYENDNGIEHESRKQSHICKACAYLDGKMSLQAFTDADCQNCDTKMTFEVLILINYVLIVLRN
jgi:hypothetical protein